MANYNLSLSPSSYKLLNASPLHVSKAPSPPTEKPNALYSSASLTRLSGSFTGPMQNRAMPPAPMVETSSSKTSGATTAIPKQRVLSPNVIRTVAAPPLGSDSYTRTSGAIATFPNEKSVLASNSWAPSTSFKTLSQSKSSKEVAQAQSMPQGHKQDTRERAHSDGDADMHPAFQGEFPECSPTGARIRPKLASCDQGGYACFDIDDERKKDNELTGQHNVMSWLGWSPQRHSSCYEALHNHFPNALPASMVHARLQEALVDRYGLTPDNTLFGCSTCPDEINSEPGGLVATMEQAWGECFPMGGISGVPFAGKTGFVAFSHHVPDDGNVLVLFGPHVGISEDGEVGKVLRSGQCSNSTSCGAVIGAYKSCIGRGAKDAEFDPTDMQMDWIKQRISPHAESISQEEEPMAALAHKAYELVEEEILKVVNTKFGSGNLVLIGGILINMPHQYSMHFLPRYFEVRREGHKPVNLMAAFECRASDPCFRRYVENEDEEITLKTKILGSLTLFKDASLQERKRAARGLVQMSYYRDEKIFSQGDLSNTYYVLISGEVVIEVDKKEVTRMSGILNLDEEDINIKEQIRTLLGKQDLPPVASFGERSLLADKTRAATVRVVSKHAIVHIMTRTQFLRLRSERLVEIVDASTISFNFAREIEKDSSTLTSHHLFAFVGWSPSFEAECFRTLHDYFPGALPSHAMHARILEAVGDSRFGLTPANTIFGTSVCPDEINTKQFSLPQIMKAYWGKCFPLGGISGTPFAGKTGFSAFSHHVPNNGNVLVLFGPHVGVSATGEVGKVHRDGQRSESTSCGAVVGAYNACLGGGYSAEDFDESDMQMDWIKSEINPKVKYIKAFNNPMAMLSHYAYEMVKTKIKQVVNNEFSDGYLVLIGGIQINMPDPYCEHFLPCCFEVTKRGEYGHVNLKPVFDPPC